MLQFEHIVVFVLFRHSMFNSHKNANMKILLLVVSVGLFSNVQAFEITFNDENKPFSFDDLKVKNSRPIIGILAQEVTGIHEVYGYGQYVSSSYVKMVESAGGRAAPILIDQTPEQIEKIFNSLNGIIFPGGHAMLNGSRYTEVGTQLFKLAVKSNKEGKVFPIWAECLGLELISMLAAGVDPFKGGGQYNQDFFTFTNATAYSTNLKFLDIKHSTFFSSISGNLIQFMESVPFAYNNHIIGITPKTFEKYEKLHQMFRITSTSTDRNGKEFISTMEGRNFPFFLFHWHPSKSQFVWIKNLDIFHSMYSVRVAQQIMNCFMDIAVQNDNKFDTRLDEENALIYKNIPIYTERFGVSMKVYFFINRFPYRVHFPMEYKLLVRPDKRMVRKNYDYSEEVVRLLTAIKKANHMYKPKSKYINREIQKHKYVQINNQTVLGLHMDQLDSE